MLAKRVKKEGVVYEALERTFNGLPVIEARQNIVVFFTDEDVAGATERDFGQCVLARACTRSLGAETVMFTRSTAYVDLPQEDGTRAVERFTLPLKTRKVVALFDMGIRTLPKGAITLQAPAPSETLEGKRATHKKYTKSKKSLGFKHSEPKNPEQVRKVRQAFARTIEVRRATGKVRLSRKTVSR